MGITCCHFEIFERADSTLVRLTIDGSEPAEADFECDLDLSGSLARSIEEIRTNDCTLDSLRYVGSLLWSGLASGSVKNLLELHRGSKPTDELFQLSLSLPVSLAPLPWETLYDERSAAFLAVHPHYCILRAPQADIRPPRQLPPKAAPIRVLVVIPEGAHLQVEHEWQNIKLAVGKLEGGVEVSRLGGKVTPELLQEALNREPWDVLHYVGHGDIAHGNPVIRMNDDQSANQELWMDGEAFSSLFFASGVRLVVLNSCYGAALSPTASLSGLGPLLMRTGVPAVVAMRYEIPDDLAIKFSSVFYSGLLHDLSGRVDLAVQKARHALFLNKRESTERGFVTPILYLAEGAERLFELQPTLQDSPAASTQSLHRPSAAVTRPDLRELIETIQEGRCVPVVGPELITLGALRTGVSPPGPRQLAELLARECGYPIDQDFEICDSAGAWMAGSVLHWVCQYYQHTRKRYQLIRSIQRAYQDSEPPPALLSVASWNVPGILYAHFDGLMEEALTRRGKPPQVLNAVDRSIPEVRDSPLLVNLKGSWTDVGSLVLTDEENDQLWDRVTRLAPQIVDLVRGFGRSLLFLGLSPRDPLARRLASRILETGKSSNQGSTYFACASHSAVDDAYWSSFNVQWIAAETEPLLADIDAALGRRGKT